MIKIDNVSLSYPSAGGKVEALRDIGFEVDKGQFVSIIGPSGCGKTTLIKVIGDIIEPTAGIVTVGGLAAHEARLRGMFSFVFQNPVLLPWRRVLDNVLLPLEVLHRKGRDPHDLLKLVGLDGFANRYPWELSGGMRQRAALARGLIFSPEVLLMDEPFASVDELTRDTLNKELIRIWQETGVTVLFITHSIEEAVFLSDRVLVLSARPGMRKVYEKIDFPQHLRTDSLKQTRDFKDKVQWFKAMLQ